MDGGRSEWDRYHRILGMSLEIIIVRTASVNVIVFVLGFVAVLLVCCRCCR